jgi:hypothetical protein
MSNFEETFVETFLVFHFVDLRVGFSVDGEEGLNPKPDRFAGMREEEVPWSVEVAADGIVVLER